MDINAKLEHVRNKSISLSELNYPLDEYQKEGANFAIIFRRAVLNFSVGLGKTATVIGACKTIIDKYPGRFLVVCPSANKFTTWTDELCKFIGKECFTIVDGNPQKRKQQYMADTPFVVTSYELLRMDKEINYILAHPWKGVILDEITRVKNHTTKTYGAVQLLQRYRYMFGMTGCSVENNVGDLFAITSSVNPFIFKGYKEFKKNFLITEPARVWNPKKKRIQYIDRIIGHKNLDSLKEHLKYVFCIKKRDDTDIHFKEVQKILYTVEPTLRELAAYNKTVESRKDSMFAAITFLREAANYPEQIGFEEIVSSKAKELVKVLNDIGEKVIVFTQYDKTLKLLKRDLEVLGRPIICVSGDEAPKAKQKAERISQFREAQKNAIMITTDCLSYGQNLQFCKVVINYDLLWNPINMEQRNGRIDRRGQEEDTVIINFMVKNSIEEKVWEVLTRKQELIKYLIGLEFGEYQKVDARFVKWLVGGS